VELRVIWVEGDRNWTLYRSWIQYGLRNRAAGRIEDWIWLGAAVESYITIRAGYEQVNCCRCAVGEEMEGDADADVGMMRMEVVVDGGGCGCGGL
jgi:hypothetical protein